MPHYQKTEDIYTCFDYYNLREKMEIKHKLDVIQVKPVSKPNPNPNLNNKNISEPIQFKISDQLAKEVCRHTTILPYEIYFRKYELDEGRAISVILLQYKIRKIGESIPMSLPIMISRELLKTDTYSVQEWIENNTVERIDYVTSILESETKKRIANFRYVEKKYGIAFASQALDEKEAEKFVTRHNELIQMRISAPIASYARLLDNYVQEAQNLQHIVEIFGINKLPEDEQMSELGKLINGDIEKKV